jgi:hypothetical protein
LIEQAAKAVGFAAAVAALSKFVPVKKTLFPNECPAGNQWCYVVQCFNDGQWLNDPTILPYGFRTQEAADREAARY